MFRKQHIEALFAELGRLYRGKPEFEQLNRDAHLAIALSDAGRPLPREVDSRVVALVEKHKPKG